MSQVQERLARAAERAGRDPAEIVLVGVSKYASPEALLSAYGQGLRDFAENRAQELAARVPTLPDDVRWHFVGRLQRNKARVVRPLAHLLHSLDRPALCPVWRRGSGPTPPVLVQVNVSGEPQKAGVAPEEAEDLVEGAISMGLEVRGLMTLPPPPERPEASRPYFAALRRLRDRIRRHHPSVVELSMGMTDDFEVAVEEGATLLRVGRAIFGPFHDDGGKSRNGSVA